MTAACDAPRSLTRSPEPAPDMTILLADGDPAAARTLGAFAGRFGYRVVVSRDGVEAVLDAAVRRPDVLLITAALAGVPSDAVVRALERKAVRPVVLCADCDDAPDGPSLRLVSSACVDKPYDAQAVGAHLIDARARRARSGNDRRISSGDAVLDVATRDLLIGGRSVTLPARECELLQYLMQRSGEPVTRDQIERDVWHGQCTTNTINVHIRRLRVRLGDDTDNPVILRTIRGTGFMFVPPSRT